MAPKRGGSRKQAEYEEPSSSETDEEDQDVGSEDDSGEEDAIDLNDPENRIIDDDGQAPPPEDDDEAGDDDDEGNGGGEEAPRQPKVPERDDALATATHSKPVHAVDVTVVDGVTYVACGGEEDRVVVYALDVTTSTNETGDATTQYRFREAASLTGHTDTVTVVSFSPTSDTIASGAMDCHVRVWSVGGDWPLLHDLADLSGEIETLTWHKSGLVLIGGATDAQLIMWNVKKGEVAQYLVGHASGVSAAAWNNDQKKLISGSSDGSLLVFNPKTGAPEVTIMKDLSPDTAGVSAVLAVSADIVVVGCEDGTLHLISLASGRVVKHLPEVHEQCVECIVAHPTKPQLFVTCSCDCKIVVWSASTFEPRATFTSDDGITRVAWFGDFIVASGTDGDLTLWNGLESSSNRPIGVLQGHTLTVNGLVVSVPDNFTASAASSSPRRPLAFSVSDDGTLKAFSLAV